MSRRQRRGARPAPPAGVLEARRRGELVVSEADVRAAIDRLAVRLAVVLADADPLLLTVMHGGLPFAGTLLTRLAFPLETGFVHVGRYREATSGGDLHWHGEPAYELTGRTVVLLDDVLDRGDTLAALLRWAREAGAEHVYSAVLVDKAVAGPRAAQADFTALSCPDRFLFGWGMDYRGYWRNLAAIYALPADMADMADMADTTDVAP